MAKGSLRGHEEGCVIVLISESVSKCREARNWMGKCGQASMTYKGPPRERARAWFRRMEWWQPMSWWESSSLSGHSGQ